MPGPTVRHAMAGMATATGLVLLGLAMFSSPAVLLARIERFQPAGADAAVEERDALLREQNALRQQVADLRSQLMQMGDQLAKAREPQPLMLKAASVSPALAQPRVNPGRMERNPDDAPASIVAPFDRQAGPSETATIAAGTLHARLERVEVCLVEARTQEAERLLEGILFELAFRAGAGPNSQATASIIVQALGAVAAADLEKAAFYTDLARPDL